MNRFHSSGTASGNVEVMWTWKMTIPITASPDRPAAGDEQQERQPELHHRPQVGREAALGEGRRSSMLL